MPEVAWRSEFVIGFVAIGIILLILIINWIREKRPMRDVPDCIIEQYYDMPFRIFDDAKIDRTGFKAEVSMVGNSLRYALYNVSDKQFFKLCKALSVMFPGGDFPGDHLAFFRSTSGNYSVFVDNGYRISLTIRKEL